MIKMFGNDPVYITNMPGQKEDRGSDEYATYIFPYEDFKNQLNTICNTLHHPVTIININYPITDDESYRKIRVDSDASYYALRNTCCNLRKAASEKYCQRCDHFFAKLCKERNENQSGGNPEKLDFFADVWDYDKNRSYRVRDGVPYLQYDCPMLGYCELCFAIHFNKKILGFLFVGEIMKESADQRDKIADSFLTSQLSGKKSIFDQSFLAFNEQNKDKQKYFREPAAAQDEILPDYFSNDDLKKRDYKKPLTKEELNALIAACITEVRNIEQDMAVYWEMKKSGYFADVFREYNQEHLAKQYDSLRAKDSITYEDTHNIFSGIWDFSLFIKEEFGFSYCCLFDHLPFIDASYFIDQNYKRAGLEQCPFDPKMLIKDFTKGNLSITQCRCSLWDTGDDDPLHCFSVNGEKLSGTREIVLACSNMAVIFGTGTQYDLTKPEIREHLTTVFRALSSVFLSISSELERISTYFLKYEYQNTMSLYEHECAHYANMISRNNRYYYDRERYESLGREKQEDIYRDIDSVAVRLQRLSQTIKNILPPSQTNKPFLQKSDIDIRDEINKWRVMYRRKLRIERKVLLNTTAQFYFFKTLYAAEDLFCNLLYNLIDNAIKYAYWGTAIQVEVGGETDSYWLSITDYGYGIETTSRPYDLFYRSDDTWNKAPGDGIGLYSAKKIAKLLDLELSHTCEEVYPFHISYAQLASKMGNFSDFPKERLYSIQDAEKNIILTPYDSYNNSGADIPPEKTILDRLNEKTYKVTFTISGLSDGKSSHDN